ncbi:MAG: ATP-binding protein [Betaproteobacteria bacterium]|nr:ATP-binding protein [Betaproteobacteria bacterium]
MTTLAIAGYRSLRDFVIPMARLTVVAGSNGSGKSSIYRALRLLAETSQGGVIASLALEGGLQSTLWAGPESFSRAVRDGTHPVEGTRRKHPVSLRLGYADEDFGYAIDLGLPEPSQSAFALDPEIKCEAIWAGPFLRKASLLVERQGGLVRRKLDKREWKAIPHRVATFDSMLTQLADPASAPEVLAVRDRIRSWRFYDALRTDPGAPARAAHIGTHTPVLSNDGADLAAALQTIREIGDAHALDDALADAFPGPSLEVSVFDGRFELQLRQHGLLRALRAGELSDGTLRYLLWIAALLSPRPPALLVLNEPETSLHPDLLPALSRLIAVAAARTQVLVVSHAPRLIAALEQQRECSRLTLEKVLGETRVEGLGFLEKPAWYWPQR